MGFANLLADGFSMAASNFLGTKSEHDDLQRLEAIENRHIDLAPEGEPEEDKEIFRLKRFEGEVYDAFVELITAKSKAMGPYNANRKVWPPSGSALPLGRGNQHVHCFSCLRPRAFAPLFV